MFAPYLELSLLLIQIGESCILDCLLLVALTWKISWDKFHMIVIWGWKLLGVIFLKSWKKQSKNVIFDHFLLKLLHTADVITIATQSCPMSMNYECCKPNCKEICIHFRKKKAMTLRSMLETIMQIRLLSQYLPCVSKP